MSAVTTIEDHIALAVEGTLVALSDTGADALVATSPANVQYLTGYRSWTHPMHITNQTFLVLTADGKRILVVPSTDGDFIAMGGHFVDEVRIFGTFYIEEASGLASDLSQEERRLANLRNSMVNPQAWVEELSQTLNAEGLGNATLAIDQGHLMPSHWHLLEEKNPKACLQDAFQLLVQVRARKTPYEVEMLRKSSACTESAILASLEIAVAGATDHEIRGAFEKSLIDSGASHLFSAIGIGTRTCLPNVLPIGTKFEPGALLRFDVGSRFGGYCSDLARIATHGPASERVKRTYQAMRNGLEAAIECLRPGVLACEVFDTAVEATRKSGVPNYRRHHCGHAIGLDTYEAPIIRPDDRTPLEPGMTFCIETPYYELGFGGIQVEDMVTITDVGAEVLTTLSRELFELEAKPGH